MIGGDTFQWFGGGLVGSGLLDKSQALQTNPHPDTIAGWLMQCTADPDLEAEVRTGRGVLFEWGGNPTHGLAVIDCDLIDVSGSQDHHFSVAARDKADQCCCIDVMGAGASGFHLCAAPGSCRRGLLFDGQICEWQVEYHSPPCPWDGRSD